MWSRSKIWLHAAFLSFFLVFSTAGFSQDGEKLFKANCASCHKLDKKLVGPALSGVQDRWESKDNLVLWVKNSQGYLGDHPEDSYAADLFSEFGGSVMPAMPLSDEEVGAILDYIANPPAPAEAAVVETTSAAPVEDDYTVFWLLGFAVVLLIVVFVLVDVKKSVKALLIDVKGEEALAGIGEYNDLELSFGKRAQLWLARNKTIAALGMVVVLVLVLNVVWNGLLGVGVYEGYAPPQPIKFSHKIHAGDNEIQCVYCHSSAPQSKHSGIPSINVCMNCHKGISEGSRWGTEEISKIYDAAGWNAETASYDKPEKPVKWIRIHNLPDHVYFNHSQHVVVGEIECQTCHGEVETFDYPMKQYAPLTMGWCINCHRETEVKMNGNDYYEKIHAELVEKYKDEGLEKFTVSQMGGLECAKCHY
ncbi:MAG: cytochrome C [Crocinitomicaceae bacterium]|nr:cytochrome C [Crocinitomicaceae bacterium]